jgi:hypothetical protein
MPDPSHGNVIPVQRRVRTGCLTCRKRRRKCDEGKPACQNCKDKNLSCRYGLNITFVNTTPNELTVTSRKQRREATDHSDEEPQLRNASEPLSSSNDPVAGLWLEHATPQPHSLPQAPLTNVFDHFQSLPASPALQGLISGSTPTTNSRQAFIHSDKSPESTPRLIEQLELELLTLYRYQIATRLDLGVGDQYFGVRALTRALSNVALYQSILALASCHRIYSGSQYSQENEIDGGNYVANAMASISMADHEDRSTISILLTLRDFHRSPPRLWAEQMSATLGNTNLVLDESADSQWQLIARLALAARLMATPTSHAVDLSFVFQRTSPMLPSQVSTHKQQLRLALSNLAHALAIPKTDADARQTTGRPPLLSTWQSCWSENQLWYSARREEMQQILEVEEFDSRMLTQVTKPSFPIVLFSNACAIVANLAHHLTALLLLHFKPRAIRPIAETGSSISPVWHAQRLIGMVAAFNQPDIFDPLVIAGLIYAARKLSHPSQITIVVDILKKATQVTGMELQEEIEKLTTAHANSVS